MTTANTHMLTPSASLEEPIDFSDLLGVDTVFPATADPVRQQELVTAFCNKVGNETPG